MAMWTRPHRNGGPQPEEAAGVGGRRPGSGSARAAELLHAVVLPAFHEVAEFARLLDRDVEIVCAPANRAAFRMAHGGALELEYAIAMAPDGTPRVHARSSLVHLGRRTTRIDMPPLLQENQLPGSLSAERVRDHLMTVVVARVDRGTPLAERPLIPLPPPTGEPSSHR